MEQGNPNQQYNPSYQGGYPPNQQQPPYQQQPTDPNIQQWQGYYQDPNQQQQYWNPAPPQEVPASSSHTSQQHENQEMAYEDDVNQEDDYMEGYEDGEDEDEDDIEDLDLSQLVQQTSHVPTTSMKISIPVGTVRIGQPQNAPQYTLPEQAINQRPEEVKQQTIQTPFTESQMIPQPLIQQSYESIITPPPVEQKAPPSFKISIPQTHNHPPFQAIPVQQKVAAPIPEYLPPTHESLPQNNSQKQIEQQNPPSAPSQQQPVKIVLSLGGPKNIQQTQQKPKPVQTPHEHMTIAAPQILQELPLPAPNHQEKNEFIFEQQPNYIAQPIVHSEIHLPPVQPIIPQVSQEFQQVDESAQQFNKFPQEQQHPSYPQLTIPPPAQQEYQPQLEQQYPQYYPATNAHIMDFTQIAQPPLQIPIEEPLKQIVTESFIPQITEQIPMPENVQMQEELPPPQKSKKKGGKEKKKKKKVKGNGDLLNFYEIQKVKVTMEFSAVDSKARCQSIYKLVLRPEDQVQDILQKLKDEDLYKKFYLDVKFHAKQQVISKVCILRKDESNSIVQDELPFLYDLTGQGTHQQKRYENVGRRLYSYEMAQQKEYYTELQEPALSVPKVLTLNFKKENLAEQLPQTLDIMVSSLLQSIENFGIRAIKYKIFDQLPGAGLSAQEGTYFVSSDMYDSQMLWLPIIQNYQMVPLIWSFKYIVPKDFTVVSSGQLYIKQIEEEGGDFARALFHYKLKDHEMAPASKIGFILGKFGEVYKMQDVRQIPNAYGFFINSDKQQLFSGNNHYMERSVIDTVLFQLQSRIIGQPFPFNALKMVFVPNLFLRNQKKQSINFIGGVHILDEELLYPKNVVEGRHRTFKAIASAISFNYFGGKVFEATPDDFWLLQGIRESIGNQFKIMKSGILLYRYHIMQTLESVYKKAKNGIERYPLKSQDLPHPAEHMLNELIYEKCELIMHMIESMIDKSYFERIIRELYAQGSYKISTALFQKIFKSVVGFKLKQFAMNWINSTSCPELSVQYTFNKKNNSLDLTLTQESAVKEHFSLIKYMRESAQLDQLLIKPFLMKEKMYNSNQGELLKTQLQIIDKMGEFSVDLRQGAVRWFEGEVNVMLYLTDGAEITPQQQKMMLKHKETSVSINIPLNVKVKKTIQNKKKEYESMHMQEHEEDEDEADASVDQGIRQSAVIDNNQWKFGMNDFELEDYPQETKNIFDVKNLESSVLWIRVDPDMEYIRKVRVKQDVNNWLFQLLLEKDIIGQIEAIRQLYKQNQKQQFIFYILQAVCTNESYFVKVRKVALKYLQKMQTSVFNEYLSHEKILLKIFNSRNFDANIGFYRSNDFSKVLEYYFDKYLLKTIAKCKEQTLFIKPEILEQVRAHTKSLAPPPPAPPVEPGSISIPLAAEPTPAIIKSLEKTPKESLLKVSSDQIAHLLLKLLQENDNSENPFDDSNYLKQIIKSLGSLDNFKYMPDIAREILRQFKLDHIGRFSPQFSVTKGAISAYFNIMKQIHIFNEMKRPLMIEEVVEDLMYIDEQIRVTKEVLGPMSAQIDQILSGAEKNWPLDLRFFIAQNRIKHSFLYQSNNAMKALYIQLKIVDQFLSEKKIWDGIHYMRQIALFLEKYLNRLDFREAITDNPRSHAIMNILWQFLTIPMGYMDQTMVFWVKKIWHLLYGIQVPMFIEKQESRMVREPDEYPLEIDNEWAPLGSVDELSKQGKNGDAVIKGSRMIKNGIAKKKGDPNEPEISMYGKLQVEKEDKIKIVFPVAKAPEPLQSTQYRTPITFTYPQPSLALSNSYGQSNKITIGAGMANERPQPKVSIQIPNFANNSTAFDNRMDDMQQMMQSLNPYDDNSQDYPMQDGDSQPGSDESVYDEFAAISFHHIPWLQKCWDVTGTLWYHEEAADFLEPVTKKVLGSFFQQYLRMIDYPMDLTTIKEKIKRQAYASVAQWQKDVETMFKNCLVFNDESSEIHKTCLKLRNFYYMRLRDEGLYDEYGQQQQKIRIR